MPWVDAGKCVGCGLCVRECPTETISMKEGVAEIDMGGCIHCGKCHDVCRQEAVRHDSEKIPEEVEKNVQETKRFMDACAEYLGGDQERQKCLNRMIKHFNKEKKIAEETLKELESIEN